MISFVKYHNLTYVTEKLRFKTKMIQSLGFTGENTKTPNSSLAVAKKKKIIIIRGNF